jgi:hypothetical protein
MLGLAVTPLARRRPQVVANREAVTRVLGDLRRGGAIEIRERRIHVVDIEALRRAARQV